MAARVVGRVRRRSGPGVSDRHWWAYAVGADGGAVLIRCGSREAAEATRDAYKLGGPACPRVGVSVRPVSEAEAVAGLADAGLVVTLAPVGGYGNDAAPVG